MEGDANRRIGNFNVDEREGRRAREEDSPE
jgi:hypothetical protein